MATAQVALWVVVVLVALALAFDFMNGFLDAANWSGKGYRVIVDGVRFNVVLAPMSCNSTPAGPCTTR